MNKLSICAIILAAGESSRMGSPKPLLLIDDKTILEREIILFRDFGVKNIFVVTGYHAEKIQPILSQLGVSAIHNIRPQEGMFSSVRIALTQIRHLCKGFFLLPVDVPLVRFCTLKLLYKTWVDNPSKICIPSFKTQNGHPPLLPISIIPNMLSWSGEQGLHGFLSTVSKDIIYVPVPDEHMLFDIDTPQDYVKFQELAKRFDVPTRSECLFMLDHVFPVPPNIRSHSIAVANLSRVIAQHLNRKSNIYINPDLAEASGLLHDIAKLESNHEQKGAQLLADCGFPLISDAIGSHMDMDVLDNDPITVAEIVFIADKYFEEDRVVSLKDRYESKMKKYNQNPKAKTQIITKLTHALHSEKRIECQIGESLFLLAKTIAEKSS